MKKKLLIPTVIIIVLLLVVVFLFINNRTYSTITIDINPSIKLKLNRNNKVISVIPLNEDGNKKISNDLKGKNVEEALSNKLIEFEVIDFFLFFCGAGVVFEFFHLLSAIFKW